MSAPEIRAWGRQRGAGAPKGQGKRCSFKGLKPQSHNLTSGWPLPDSGAGYSEQPKDYTEHCSIKTLLSDSLAFSASISASDIVCGKEEIDPIRIYA
jgi:hypothetical protein